MSNKHLVAVDAGALQMVFNILERGTPVQVEAMLELKKTCVPIEDLEAQINIDNEVYKKFMDSDGNVMSPSSLQKILDNLDILLKDKGVLESIPNACFFDHKGVTIPTMMIGNGSLVFDTSYCKNSGQGIIVFNALKEAKEPSDEVTEDECEVSTPLFALNFTNPRSLSVFNYVVNELEKVLVSDEERVKFIKKCKRNNNSEENKSDNG